MVKFLPYHSELCNRSQDSPSQKKQFILNFSNISHWNYKKIQNCRYSFSEKQRRHAKCGIFIWLLLSLQAARNMIKYPVSVAVSEIHSLMEVYLLRKSEPACISVNIEWCTSLPYFLFLNCPPQEMTHSWPPLLTAIHTPSTGETSKSPFPAKVRS